MRRRSVNLIAAYYLVTPAFAIADLVFHAPVRVAGLSDPAYRLAYYAIVFALGILCRARPEVTPFVGITESTVNLLLLFVAILLPIWSLPDALLSGAPVQTGFSGMTVANALLSGTALIVSFHRHEAAAARIIAGKFGR